MSKESLNRAQRRRNERSAKAHVPSFWDSMFNRVWVIGLGAAFVGIIVYSVIMKQSPATTPKLPATQPPSTTAPVTTKPAGDAQPAPQPPQPPATADKVKTEDVKIGTGAEVKMGDTITVHYTGTLADGTKFDSSRDKGTPYTYTVGKPGTIQGFSLGVIGMKVGGRRNIVIPPSLGYGAQGKGQIPPNASLNFDMEVLKIEPKP